MMSGQNPHPGDMRLPPSGLTLIGALFVQNWAMDVRTFARIKTVIWDQLLATKAEINQS